MELKSMVHTMIWLVIDGLAAIWVLHMIASVMAGGSLAQTILLMSQTICG